MSNNSVWTERRTVVASDGVELCVRECGSTNHPTLLLVHGFPDSSRSWDKLAAVLAPSWHVVVYDVRGAGESSTPSSRKGYALEQLADDFFAVVDSIKVENPDGSRRKVHVFAHDWGSIQTWEAVTDPRAEGVVATYTSMSGPCIDHIGHLMRTAPMKHPISFLGQTAKSWYVYFFHLPVIPELLWRLPTAKRIFSGRPTLRRDGSNGVNLYRANIARRMFKPGQRRTELPVHVIVLTKDIFVSPFMTSAVTPWASDLTWSEIKAPHWAQEDHTEAVASTLTGYLLDRDRPAERATLGA